MIEMFDQNFGKISWKISWTSSWSKNNKEIAHFMPTGETFKQPIDVFEVKPVEATPDSALSACEVEA